MAYFRTKELVCLQNEGTLVSANSFGTVSTIALVPIRLIALSQDTMSNLQRPVGMFWSIQKAGGAP